MKSTLPRTLRRLAAVSFVRCRPWAHGVATGAMLFIAPGVVAADSGKNTPPAPAASALVTLDGARITIPAPQGMISVLGCDHHLDSILETLTAPRMRLEGAFALRKAWDDPDPRRTRLSQYASVQSNRSLSSSASENAQLFAQLRPLFIKQFAGASSLLFGDPAAILGRLRQRLRASGVDNVDVTALTQVPVGVIRDDPVAAGGLIVANARVTVNGKQATSRKVYGTVIMAISGRILSLYYYRPLSSDLHEVIEVRDTVREWLDRIELANR